jgi:hypothetical protein
VVAHWGCPPDPSKGRIKVNQRTLYTIVAVLVGLAALIFIIQNL